MEAAVKMPKPPRTSDRVIEALATLGALLDRTISEVKKNLDKDIEEQMTGAVREAEEALRAEATQQLEKALQGTQNDLTSRFQAELHATIGTLRAEFETERTRLNQEIQKS